MKAGEFTVKSEWKKVLGQEFSSQNKQQRSTVQM